MTPEAMIAPMTCATMYAPASLALIFLARNTPRVTAGFTWQPEIGPMVYTMASSERPKAAATPAKPIWLPARTALPTPPKTRTNVPTNSAKYLFMDASSYAFSLLRGPFHDQLGAAFLDGKAALTTLLRCTA